MNKTILMEPVDPAVAELTQKNFEQHQQKIFVRTDRVFAWLMGLQYVLSIAFALLVSPRTWVGASTQTHPHVWLAILLGGVLAGYPIFLAIRQPGTAYTRQVIAVSQALFSALLIHLTGGRIETHFHVFGSLAFLAFYRDWRVLISASAIVAVDHFVRGAWFPFSVYGVNSGAEWRFLEHAGWVLFEDAFLIGACVTATREMRSMAQRQAELELAKERIELATADISRQSAILNSVLLGMSDGVVVAGPAGEVLHFNPAAERILGKTAEQAAASGSEEGGLLKAEQATLGRALSGETVELQEMRIEGADGAEDAWLEISGGPLVSQNGSQVGGVVVFRDITDRRRILAESARARELAERANNAKSEFLSRMSHELRTPMNAILGFSQLLQMDDLTEDQMDSVNQIVTAGTHLLKLINEVLDISRIESGRLSVSKEPINVLEVVREVAALVQPLAQQQGVKIVVPETDAEVFAMADRQRLLQVVLNLVSNGIKYNVPSGQVAIELEVTDGQLRLRVRDTGIGIPQEKRSLIFTPFERIGAERTTVEGTGLGLALSKRLTEAMGGRIGLEPSETGTCFFVELPAAESPIRTLESSGWQAQASVDDAPEIGATILLIEDNPANVRLMEKILRGDASYRLIVAMNGSEGLALARAEKPDLVLLDLNLPDTDGHAILTTLKADPTLADIPVIVVSADAVQSRITRLMTDGASAYMTKPLDVPKLLSLLEDTCTPEAKSA